MDTLRKLSKTFYQITKVLLIITIVLTAIGFVVGAIVGVIELFGSIAAEAAGETAAAEALLAAFGTAIGWAVWAIISMIFSIVGLVLTKKARGSNEVKRHVLAAIFGFLGMGITFVAELLPVAAAVLAIVYIKKGGAMDDSDKGDFAFVEKAEAKAKAKKAETVEATPVEDTEAK